MRVKRRRIAWALAALMCVIALFSGAHLILLHIGHECHPLTCPVCMAIRQIEACLHVLAVLGMLALLRGGYFSRLRMVERWFVPHWTPVLRKVMLLD